MGQFVLAANHWQDSTGDKGPNGKQSCPFNKQR